MVKTNGFNTVMALTGDHRAVAVLQRMQASNRQLNRYISLFGEWKNSNDGSPVVRRCSGRILRIEPVEENDDGTKLVEGEQQEIDLLEVENFKQAAEFLRLSPDRVLVVIGKDNQGDGDINTTPSRIHLSLRCDPRLKDIYSFKWIMAVNKNSETVFEDASIKIKTAAVKSPHYNPTSWQ